MAMRKTIRTAFLLWLLFPAAFAGAKDSPARTSESVARVSGEPFVDVVLQIPDAIVDLKYATTDNFLKRAFYESKRCLLRRSVAKRLEKAADLLRKKTLRLVLWDCYRPLHVQEAMWAAHPVRGEVAPPQSGSNHNRGAAVDVTLADLSGTYLEMPTKFDHFGKDAWRNAALRSKTATKNREVLKDAMARAGFSGIRREWWHYNAPKPKRHPLCRAHIKELAQGIDAETQQKPGQKP